MSRSCATRFGLDRPLLEQYFVWLGQLMRLDLGESVFLGQTVLEAIGQRAPLTVTLCTFAVLIATFVGIPLGVLAAVKRGGWIDRLGMSAAFLGASLPTFWVALLLIQTFAIRLGDLSGVGLGTAGGELHRAAALSRRCRRSRPRSRARS